MTSLALRGWHGSISHGRRGPRRANLALRLLKELPGARLASLGLY